ncbi:MAG: hypothetical protein K8R50_05610 [Betaproteobacteria bacterium]|nr:hypothetical protein [Betaproteobacteria bacterium]MCX7196368.1 hypothetical protein [Pseudomonadota bacterium]
MMASVRGDFYLKLIVYWLIASVIFIFCAIPTARADDNSQKGDSAKVMEAFEKQASQIKIDRPSTIQKKHLTMFLLGVPLLIMLLITGALGIAMGIYGKQVFVWHMVSAGLTITLAFVHAIVGIIWFYPF